MKRSIFIFLVNLWFANAVLAQASVCDELLKNEADFELLYEQSALVFIAQISPRKGPNDAIYNYKTFDPVLQGSLAQEGFITFEDGCYPRDDEAIYIFFLETIEEKIAGYNSAFFALPNGGPGFTWIGDWVMTKMEQKNSQ